MKVASTRARIALILMSASVVGSLPAVSGHDCTRTERYVAYLGDKEGLVDESGRFRVPPTHEVVNEPSDGVAAFRDGTKWGFLDCEGRELVPARFDAVGDFREGFAPVRTSSGWGFVDKHGDLHGLGGLKRAGEFHEGLAGACIESNECGYLNHDLKWEITPQFEFVTPFSEGRATAGLGDSVLVIDRRGNAIPTEVPVKYVWRFEEGLAPFESPETGKYGFLDRDGRVAIPARFDLVYGFTRGRSVASLGGLYGVINQAGDWVVKPKYCEAGLGFEFGLLEVRVLHEKWQFIDRDGRVVIGPRFDRVWGCTGPTLCDVEIDERRFFIDHLGNSVAPVEREDESMEEHP